MTKAPSGAFVVFDKPQPDALGHPFFASTGVIASLATR
jgi:hypothetical protein